MNPVHSVGNVLWQVVQTSVSDILLDFDLAQGQRSNGRIDTVLGTILIPILRHKSSQTAVTEPAALHRRRPRLGCRPHGRQPFPAHTGDFYGGLTQNHRSVVCLDTVYTPSSSSSMRSWFLWIMVPH